MLNYRVKVRKQSFLWGGADVDVAINSPLILAIRVHEDGEEIRFGVWNSISKKKVDFGKLAPGECFCINLDETSGVYGQCETDTFVECSIFLPTSVNTSSKE